MSASRFNDEETKQLAALANSIDFTKKHLVRAETLRVDELPLTAYEQSIVDDYRSQLRAVIQAFERLIDLRLEKSPYAAQAGRAIEQGWELLCALQGEVAAIVDSYYGIYKDAG